MHEETARHILEKIQFATISTVTGAGDPWGTPVFYAHDGQGNLYWSSHPESVHSQNLAGSHKAFITIYNSKAREGEGTGLYMRALVETLDDQKEILHALELLGQRRGRPFLHPEKFYGNGPQRIYKAAPQQCWINDADQDADGDFIKDYKVEIQPFEA